MYPDEELGDIWYLAAWKVDGNYTGNGDSPFDLVEDKQLQGKRKKSPAKS